MFIHRCKQRSDQWFELRLGKVTGTRFKDMMTAKPAGFETLCRKVAAEHITGQSADPPFKISAAMQHGIDTEDEARMVLEVELGEMIKEVGFIGANNYFGVSPDGIIFKEPLEASMGVEIKCPMAHTHLGYLMDPMSLFKAYKWQVLGALWVSGFERWYLASYCPEFDPEKRLYVYGVALSDADRALINDKVDQLRARVKEIMELAK